MTLVIVVVVVVVVVVHKQVVIGVYVLYKVVVVVHSFVHSCLIQVDIMTSSHADADCHYQHQL